MIIEMKKVFRALICVCMLMGIFGTSVYAESNAKSEKSITKVFAYHIIAKEGTEPALSYDSGLREYCVDNISFKNKGVSAPYTWETATAIYRANDGYYFSETDAYNGKSRDTMVQMKYIDKKTMEATFYTLVGSERDTQITESMKRYAERHEDAYSSTPHIATAEIYDPLDTALLQSYPTAKWSVTNRGQKVQHKAPVEVLATDLSDYIPDMVGEWYLVRLGHNNIGYIQKAYLKNIKSVDMWEDSPGVSKDSFFQFAGGTGTQTDPYLVATAEQFDAIRQDMDAHYKLVADIDLSRWGNWIPIGGTPAYGGHKGDSVNTAQFGSGEFSGSLNGNGHVVSGMTIIINEEVPYMYERGNTRFYGLFANIVDGGKAYSGPTVFNLGLVDYTIDITYGNLTNAIGGNHFFLGTLAARSMGADIQDCYTAGGTVRFNAIKSDYLQMKIGGLIGEASSCDILRCFNTGDITIQTENHDGNALVGGGIVGQALEVDLTECFNSGNITFPLYDDGPNYEYFFGWMNSYVGGIAGEAVTTIATPGYTVETYITNCYNSGELTARAVDGIMVYTGSNIKCYIKNCYNTGKLAYHPDEQAAAPNMIHYLHPGAVKTNVTNNGNSVSGSAWKYSSKLGRMVLSSIPEDADWGSGNTSFIPEDTSFGSGNTSVIPEDISSGSGNTGVIPVVSPAYVEPFTDVKSDAWYAEPVKWAVSNGITSGTSATTFSPDATCTRAQILTFLWRAVGSPEAASANPFRDVTVADYFYHAAVWAYEKGMVTGTVFAGSTPCTRSSTVQYLWINAGKPLVPNTGTFSDVGSGDPFQSAVSWAVQNGITSGTSATTFSPDATCTRGQIATFLWKAIQQL